MTLKEAYIKYNGWNDDGKIYYGNDLESILMTLDLWQAIKTEVEKPTRFIVEERWADCGTDTVDRPLTQAEINQKFARWWEYITESCGPCSEKGPCMREGCDLWPYVSIDGDPIRRVKPLREVEDIEK